MSDPRQLLEATERAQQMASDPYASAWVGANAGAGKTHVLKMRVLKLLLAGTPPDKILCLTFTRAAAAEMAQRVFNELSQWATCDVGTLTAILEKLLGRQPTHEELSLARQLFARAIETPGGLKVQTIHAFCERLLQRFPLEAGVPPGFSILDDEASQTIRREAIDAVLLAAAREGGPVQDAMQKIVAFAVDDSFDTLLASALAQRKWLEAMSRLDLRDDPTDAEQIYRTALGVRTGSLADAEQQLAGVLTNEELTRAAAVLGTGSVTDQKLGAVLKQAATAANTKMRISALTQCFLTSSGDARKNLMTAKLRAAFPDLDTVLANAQSQFIDVRQELAAHVLIDATLALLCVANAVEQRCAEAKARRAALDYDDLIAKTANLLGDGGSSTQWVLFKLDGGLDHVLVDEAQDTSPVQWSIVSALANEFFAGSSASEVVRTVFAVGDEKQSIYSFQGAQPEEFAAAGREFARLAAATEQIWRNLPLTLSFRSTAPVLESVDRVFSDASRTPGLTATSGPVRHQAMRIGHAGSVELWPTEKWQQDNPADPWAPLTETAQQSPVAQLANRIADTIASWLTNGERLSSTGQLIRPGDILILVRKRAPFAAPMVSALKARGIPVAGSDRMQLNQQIAVQDLMALGEFLVLPEDDLALATVLKSPIFDLNDDDLIAIAPGRKGALWTALLEAAKTNARLTPAASTLRRWRAEADFRPPYEFFAALLDNEGLRARMLSRLGPEAADPLDEFVNLALTYDSRSPPSLQGFLLWLRRLKMEIKRDQEHGRDEVRVMTVHGAKGLEAPIVFLPDTCSTASPGDRGGLVKLANAVLPEEFPAPCVWPVRNTSHHGSIQIARQAVKAAEAEERNRLLYVAMTRAKDRLYVSGFEGKKGRGQGCWYDLVEAGLQNDCERKDRGDGQIILRLSSLQLAALKPPEATVSETAPLEALPAWARSKAPREPVTTIPLAPSRLGSLETDESGEPIEQPRTTTREVSEPASVSPIALAADYRFLRGTLTHALLEHLPGLPRDTWQPAATAFIALRGQGVSKRVQASIVQEALAILSEPEFGALFGPDSRAEVPIAAEIPDPRGIRPTLRLTGQIDRLVRLPHEVMILDYKTNRPPPLDPVQVAPIYLSQLAAYRLAMKQLFPELPVRGAILWTDGCRLMPIPSELLDEREDRLWEQGSARLDAV